jgi:hypothetical protein
VPVCGAPWSGGWERNSRSFDVQTSNCRVFPLKNFLIATRVFALVTLLFVPAITVLLLVAFVSGQTLWFAFIGLPALLANAVIVFAKPQRDRVWHWVNAIAGTKARL